MIYVYVLYVYMEKRTCEDPNDDPRGSVEPTKAVTVRRILVSVQATETYRQLALRSGRGEFYDDVSTAGTR
jgi:hypothetical protein